MSRGERAAAARATFDGMLLFSALALTALGAVMVYSASAVVAEARVHNQFYFLTRQLAAVGLGVTLLLAAIYLGPSRLERLAYPILGLTLIGLLVVLVPGVGRMAGGARRWIDLGFISFQPAEASKVALVFFLARRLSRTTPEALRSLRHGFLPLAGVAGLLMALCLAEKDFGSCVVLAGILAVVLFAAGVRPAHLGGAALLVLPFGYWAIAGTRYRMARISAWLDPFEVRDGAGFQMVESLLGIGNGGWLGQGLGQGKGKLFYLPAAHTDFIGAVVAEELGLVGMALLVALYGLFVWRGLRAATRAADAFGCWLALGVTALVGVQALLNLSVVLVLLPTKGLTLPFVSYGGSSLITLLGATGALLAVSSGTGGFLRSAGARSSAVRMMIAGGGTGGHVFPGVAIAEEVVGRHPDNDVVFVGTARGLEARVVPQEGFPFEQIEVKGLKGKGLLALVSNLLLLPRAFVQCWRLLRRWRPDVVVGVGGYASGPAVLTAWLLRIPTAVQEQNAVAGFTNRVLGKFVDAAFTAFPAAGGYFAKRKVHQLGNPIRRSLMDNYVRPVTAHDRQKLLVFGGSQGAHALNMRLVDALPHLADLKDRLLITHQTGARDRDEVERGYRAAGFDPDVREFIADMSAAYAGCDLVVCRAGATTLAELTVCKKPSILVPFPAAADNHQVMNARSLAEAGAAVMIEEKDLSGGLLASEIRAILSQPERRQAMARAAGRLGNPQAAGEIADVCTELLRRRWGSPRGQPREPGWKPVRPGSPMARQPPPA